DGQWRFPEGPVGSKRFALAVQAYEDRRFRRHPGVDPFAVFRALRDNLRERRTVSGASTLTMQVIRLSRKGKDRTAGEKLLEAALALRLELAFSKDSILSLYAAHAPFGGNVVGLPAAAWRYFGRAPDELSWGEAALLAVLPNSPALMHPGRNRDALHVKRDRLLKRLWREGVMDSLACALALREPLPEKPLALPRGAPQLLDRLAGEGKPSAWRTTLDADLQARATAVLERHRAELEGNGIGNGAIIVLHAPTGRVLAYVGNMPGATSEGRDVDIITSPRSTGSLLKPFLYASMLEAGELLPGTLVPDVPSRIGGFTPQNFDRGYEGVVPARMALARSLNVPAVHMLRDHTIERFLYLLRGLGLTTATRSSDDYGLTLVLGGAEGTLWDLAGMYAGLSREARRESDPTYEGSKRRLFFPPHVLSESSEPSRTSAFDEPKGRDPIGPGAAWLTLQAMAEVARPDADQYWRQFNSSRWVAWKTGTSFGFRDAWAMGVTPEYVVGVWIGNANGQGRPGMTGIQMAAPVMFEVFNLLPATTLFHRPSYDLTRIPVCPVSGMRPGPNCPRPDTVYAPLAGRRTPVCPYHRLVHLDQTGAWRVHDGCESVASMRHEPWFVLPPSQEWHYRRRHSDYRPLPPWRADCEEGAPASGRLRAMELIYPRGGAKIYVPLDLDARRSRTVFEAVHRDPGATVYWYLDDDYLGSTREFHKMEADPSPGPHVLLLIDSRGERLEYHFEALAGGETRSGE
ncbi:MAG TPA: penicillin-binding protein 1C, partial [Fibrobacteria bacterium]|nr:penicillin-binding protein 1C [Fibrobacteria bacterium]